MTCGQMFLFLLVPVFTSCRVTDGCPEIIRRESWEALNATTQSNLAQNPPPLVVVHHSDTKSCTTRDSCKTQVKSIQRYHRFTKGWSDIGYNFLIGSEGTIYEGRGWGLIGAHTIGFNDRSIGICLIGKLQDNNPSESQLRSLMSLIACGVSIGKIDDSYKLIGHRQVSATICPGDNLFNILKTMPNFEAHPVKSKTNVTTANRR